MYVYSLQASYVPGKHRLIAATYDADDFKTELSTFAAHTTLRIDEVAPLNRGLCLDLARTCNQTDINGEPKYYVNDSGQLCENIGWEPHYDLPS